MSKQTSAEQMPPTDEELAERHWSLFSVIRKEYDHEAAKAEAKRAYHAGLRKGRELSASALAEKDARIAELRAESLANYNAADKWEAAALLQQEMLNEREAELTRLREALEKIVAFGQCGSMHSQVMDWASEAIDAKQGEGKT
jgi:hypothetical protein